METHQTKRSHLTEILLAVVLVGLLGVGLLVGVLLYRAYTTPLATAMPVAEVENPPVAQQPAAILPAADKGQPPAQDQPTATPEVAAVKPSGVCGQSGSLYILVIGRDDKHWVEPHGADAIRYVKADFDHKQITMFTFHRDLWVETASLQDLYGIQAVSVGPLYEAVLDKQGHTRDGNIAASGAVATALLENFGLLPVHYVSIYEHTFAAFVDTVGGVEVDVPKPLLLTNVSEGDAIALQPGKQVMNGRTADAYIRFIDDGGEWDRIDRQNLVLAGFIKKLITPEGLVKAPDLAKQFLDVAYTDLSPEQLVALTCLAHEASLPNTGGGIDLQTFTKDEIRYDSPHKMTLLDLVKTRTRIQELFQ